jgi:hypothetical protein
MHFASIYTIGNSSTAREYELASMIAAGKLSVSVNEEFPFTQEGVQAHIREVDRQEYSCLSHKRIVVTTLSCTTLFRNLWFATVQYQ